MNIITKDLTETGALTIPIELRKKTGIRENRTVDIIDNGDGTLLIRKHVRKCMFCGSFKKVLNFHGTEICVCCREELNRWEEHSEDVRKALGLKKLSPYGES